MLEPSHTSRVVAFQIWVKVGSADERPEEVGLAHLHEHMLFKGTKRRGLGEIARSVEANGGEINAWTSFDQTVYHVVLASQFAREGLDVLADAVRNSAFDPQELTREIEVVCEEIKRGLDMPSRRASRDLFALAYPAHPYGRPVIGFEENVRAHTRERVVGFYERHYTPANMVLSAVGDFDEAALRTWVDELLGGDWRGGLPTLPARPVEPPFQGVQVKLVDDEVKEAHLHLAFQIPGVSHIDTPTLDVLATLVGLGDSSRLSLEVKRKRSLAKEVSAWAYTPKDPGLFAASLLCKPESLEAAFEETVRVLSTVTSVEVEADELDTVKAVIEAEAVYHRETVQGVARKLGYHEAAAGGIEQEARYYEAVSLVTPARLREVAAKYLTFDRAVITGLLPKGTAFTEAMAKSTLQRLSAQRPSSSPARRLPPSQPIRLVPSGKKAKPELTIEKLPSGATVVVKEERAVPLFAVRGSFLGGLRYETAEDNGVSGLVARTLSRGTKRLDAEQISALSDQLAGSVGAVAGRSSITVRAEFLSKHFDRGFDLFTQVVNEPSFPAAEFAREQQQVLHDLAAKEDRPSAVAFELFAKTLFRAHPYRMNPSGERTTVEKLNPEALAAYHAKFMDPSQLTLAVVGDVDTQTVLERARAAFGTSRGGAVKPPLVPPEPAWSGPREAKKTLVKAQTHLVLGFPGVSVTDPSRRQLEVLSTILSGQSGRLFLELRDKRSMAYSVSSMSLEGLDPGYFALYIATSPEKVNDALAGMREELTKIREEPVTAAELARAKQYLIGTHEIGLQRNGARASVIALDTVYGLGPEHSRGYADEVTEVTAESIREVARRLIDFEKSALVVVGA